MADEAPAAPAVLETPVAAPVIPAAPLTEVYIPADGGFPAPQPELPLETPAAAATPEAKPDEGKPRKNAYQARLDTLTAQKNEANRKLAEEQAKTADALRQAELFRAMAEGKAPPADGAAPAATATPANPGAFANEADFKKAVETEAARQAAVKVIQDRTSGLLKAGETEFKDFTDRCNEVARLGAGDRPDFMEIVADPSIISDGHKLIAQLADKPEEAARILALPTLQMSAALVKFQAENNKPAPPKPISGAPPPIKTIDGTAHPDTEPKDTDDMAVYAAKFRATQAKKLQERAPSRFARH